MHHRSALPLWYAPKKIEITQLATGQDDFQSLPSKAKFNSVEVIFSISSIQILLLVKQGHREYVYNFGPVFWLVGCWSFVFVGHFVNLANLYKSWVFVYLWLSWLTSKRIWIELIVKITSTELNLALLGRLWKWSWPVANWGISILFGEPERYSVVHCSGACTSVMIYDLIVKAPRVVFQAFSD